MTISLKMIRIYKIIHQNIILLLLMLLLTKWSCYDLYYKLKVFNVYEDNISGYDNVGTNSNKLNILGVIILVLSQIILHSMDILLIN